MCSVEVKEEIKRLIMTAARRGSGRIAGGARAGIFLAASVCCVALKQLRDYLRGLQVNKLTSPPTSLSQFQ
jgi:hypothetical protein